MAEAFFKTPIFVHIRLSDFFMGVANHMATTNFKDIKVLHRLDTKTDIYEDGSAFNFAFVIYINVKKNNKNLTGIIAEKNF